jgi:hypothetical protein
MAAKSCVWVEKNRKICRSGNTREEFDQDRRHGRVFIHFRFRRGPSRRHPDTAGAAVEFCAEPHFLKRFAAAAIASLRDALTTASAPRALAASGIRNDKRRAEATAAFGFPPAPPEASFLGGQALMPWRGS